MIAVFALSFVTAFVSSMDFVYASPATSQPFASSSASPAARNCPAVYLPSVVSSICLYCATPS